MIVSILDRHALLGVFTKQSRVEPLGENANSDFAPIPISFPQLSRTLHCLFLLPLHPAL